MITMARMDPGINKNWSAGSLYRFASRVAMMTKSITIRRGTVTHIDISVRNAMFGSKIFTIFVNGPKECAPRISVRREDEMSASGDEDILEDITFCATCAR